MQSYDFVANRGYHFTAEKIDGIDLKEKVTAESVNYDSIKNYFMPQAQMFNFRNDTLETFTIDQFVDIYKSFLESNSITSFYEEEIKGATDQFGRIAQRMSTYKTYINTMDSTSERGVNSFQLIKTPQGWKVSSII